MPPPPGGHPPSPCTLWVRVANFSSVDIGALLVVAAVLWPLADPFPLGSVVPLSPDNLSCLQTWPGPRRCTDPQLVWVRQPFVPSACLHCLPGGLPEAAPAPRPPSPVCARHCAVIEAECCFTDCVGGAQHRQTRVPRYGTRALGPFPSCAWAVGRPCPACDVCMCILCKVGLQGSGQQPSKCTTGTGHLHVSPCELAPRDCGVAWSSLPLFTRE